jgi:hypothetical protein
LSDAEQTSGQDVRWGFPPYSPDLVDELSTQLHQLDPA